MMPPEWAGERGRRQLGVDEPLGAAHDQEDAGYEHHSGVEEFEAGRERNNLLTAAGFFVLHWTWRALHDRPMELLNQLLATLNARRR